ncbi:MAG: hypothetical protein ABIZ70_12280 [Gemmatimonadales bacterium]
MSLFRRVLLCASLLLSACGDTAETPLALVQATPVGEEFGAALVLPIEPLVPLTQLEIPTFEGSGQAVHPDVVRFPSPWHGWEYWMAYTPYPGSSEEMENPSLAVSHDGVKWEMPAGFPNPVVAKPTSGYNSDPDLTYDASADRLVMIYREVSDGQNIIKAISSGDGRRWTLPRITFRRRNHGIVSPTIASRPGEAPAVWYVDAGTRKCRNRVTRVMTQRGSDMAGVEPARPESGWDGARQVRLQQPGFSVWHIDVTWVPARNEYWAIYPANRNYSCYGRDLFFARSADGVNWTTYRTPVLQRSDADWIRGSLYRGSLLYDPSRDAIRIYLSASAPGSIWHLGYVEYRFADFLRTLERNPGVAPTAAAPLPAVGKVVDARMDP